MNDMHFLKKAILSALIAAIAISAASCRGGDPSDSSAQSTSPTGTSGVESQSEAPPAGTVSPETDPTESQPFEDPISFVYRDPHYTFDENGVYAAPSDNPLGAVFYENELLSGDYCAELQLSPDSLKTRAGILFHATSSESRDGYEGYAFMVEADAVCLYRITYSYQSGMAATELAYRVVEMDKRTWKQDGCTLRVERVGDVFRCYFCNDADGVEPWPEFEYALDDIDGIGIGYIDNGRGASFNSLRLSEVSNQTTTDAPTYVNPVFDAWGADPGVLYHDGTYYLYSTNYVSGQKGYPVYTSPDLVNWEFAGMCTGELWSTNYYWAPEVVEKDGKFYMIATNNVSLGIAVSDSPLGPFEPMGDLLLEQAIDGNFFFDNGKIYLYYVNVKEGEPYGIFGCELTEDLSSIKPGTTTLLLQYTDPWEATTVEAPEMIKHNGVYYLTYSGNTYTSEKYAIGYATSDSPLGEFHRYSANPILSYTSEIQGTGHHCFTTSPDGSELWIVYHVHSAIGVYEPRTLCIDRVRFVPTESGIDRLEAYGPTHTPQPYPVS
ncbi:MAG: hypothetical protein E7610_06470 [Ruminococcaceae bacterium]|nr:hypothetical protein [Oscillospiraceae bacterium]